MSISYRIAYIRSGVVDARYTGTDDDPLVAVTYDDPARGFIDVFYSMDRIATHPLGRLFLRLADLELRSMRAFYEENCCG